MARRRHVTATDVAREVGVSQTTVSYVLNDVPNQTISAETRQRIHDAVKKLGYTPSAAARTLRTGRSNLVLLLLADLPMGHSAIELIEQLTHALQQQGLSVITRIEDGRGDTSLWADLAPRAVVLFAPVQFEQHERMDAAGIQMVEVWRSGSGAPGDDMLTQSQNWVGRLQARHLADAGHRRLGYAIPVDERLRDFYELRLHGVQMACSELGLPAPVVREVGTDADAAAVAARSWRSDDVTAVCAFNDELAFVLLAGTRREGIRVPRDLAVIGVDDIPVAAFADPPLTTVNLHLGTVAGDIAEAIVAGPRNRPALDPTHSSATVIVRDSA